MKEEDSPFKLKRTDNIFKNTANVALKGTTFDASHMDNFLKGQFGDSVAKQSIAGGISHRQASN